MNENISNSIFTIAVCNIVKTAPAIVVLVPHTDKEDGIEMCEIDGRYNIHVRGMSMGDGRVNLSAVSRFLRHVADHLEATENGDDLVS